MTQTNLILPEVRAGTVSREALVQAALKEITQNYREASLSNVAREYGVSLAYVSECVRAETGRTYKELLQKHRMETISVPASSFSACTKYRPSAHRALPVRVTTRLEFSPWNPENQVRLV